MSSDPVDREYREAIEDCGRALELDPESLPAYTNRALAWRRWGEWKLGQEEDPRPQFEKAVQDYSEVLRRDPRSARAYRMRGYLHQELEQFEQAVSDYQAALRINYDPEVKAALDELQARLREEGD